MGDMRRDESLPIVQQILQRIDFADFVNQYTTLNSKGYGLCPFHEERHPSFNIEPARKLWHCFGCGRGGGVFKFVMLKKGISFKKALRFLAEYLHVNFPTTGREALAICQIYQEEKAEREALKRDIVAFETILGRVHAALCEKHRMLLRKQDKARDDYTRLLFVEHNLDLFDQRYNELKGVKRDGRKNV